MMRRFLPLIGMMLAISANSALGQDKGSHARIPDWDAGSNPANAEAMTRQLRARLGASASPSIDPDLLAQVQKLLNNSNLDKARQAFENNPELKKRLNDFASQNPNWKNQIREKLASDPGGRSQRQIDDLLRNLPVQNRSTSDGRPDVPPNLMNPRESDTADKTSDRISPRPNSKRPPWLDDERDSLPADSQKSERFREFVKRMSRYLPKSMADSDAIKRLTKSFNQIDWNKTSKWKFLPDNLSSNLKLGDRLQGTGHFFRRAFDKFEGRRLPDLPDFKAPNMPSGSSIPGFDIGGPTGGSSGNGITTAILVVGVIILVAFLARRFLLQARTARSPGSSLWEVGDWPIDPRRIRTGDELVEAFDYLALRTSGKPARHWHHHTVAKQFAAEDQSRQATANRLANVYEQARYAPPQEVLAEKEIDAARMDLCTLAGVTEP